MAKITGAEAEKNLKLAVLQRLLGLSCCYAQI
jgi:hypothetical protein